MRTAALLVFAALLGAACPAAVKAHHVVWLDFSAFDLSAWSCVVNWNCSASNGCCAPISNDVDLVKEMVIANVVRDYAPFDVQFTTFQPVRGRYTRVVVRPTAKCCCVSGSSTQPSFNCNATCGVTSCPSGSSRQVLFGTASSLSCASGSSLGPCCSSCTGRGSSNTSAVSHCEVFAGTLPRFSEWQDANATHARISNSISHTLAHEVGHLLDLSHSDSYDDFRHHGTTSDGNKYWHVMNSGLSRYKRATRDRFLSLHSSRYVVYPQLQVRNHFGVLPDLDDDGDADLTYGRSPDPVEWTGHRTVSGSLGSAQIWQSGAGEPTDVFLVGDVTGDGKPDLVRGHPTGSSTVEWHVHAGTGTKFAAASQWSSGAGGVGDRFRLADVTGDGKKDLLVGADVAVSPPEIDWSSYESSGSAFTTPSGTWATTEAGGVFLFGDATGDGREDLVRVELTAPCLLVHTHPSLGSTAGGMFEDELSITTAPDYVLLGDVDGDVDTRADLIFGTVTGETAVEWSFALSGGCPFQLGPFSTPCIPLPPPSPFPPLPVFRCFMSPAPLLPFPRLWIASAGHAGDQFRSADIDGDGLIDLCLARPVDLDTTTCCLAGTDLATIEWRYRENTDPDLASPVPTPALGSEQTWSSDASDEGDVVP